jgi:hypothetical protein
VKGEKAEKLTESLGMIDRVKLISTIAKSEVSSITTSQ